MATFDDFQKLDIRIGTIIEAENFAEAKKPALKLTIDFGELGMKQSSAQITKRYKPEDLIGTQVAAVVNFPPLYIARYKSEVLVLGVYEADDDVVLLKPDAPVTNGTMIG